MPYQRIMEAMVVAAPCIGAAIFCDGEGERVIELRGETAPSLYDLSVVGAECALFVPQFEESMRSIGNANDAIAVVIGARGALLFTALPERFSLTAWVPQAAFPKLGLARAMMLRAARRMALSLIT